MFDLHGKNPGRDRFFAWVARYGLGVGLLVFFLVPALRVHFEVEKVPSFSVIFGLPLFLAWLVALILQFTIRRKRPYEVLHRPAIFRALADGTSFPSAHTTVSFAIVGWVTVFLDEHRMMGDFKGAIFAQDYALFAFVFFVACLISFSRYYIGVHFFSDLVAGAVIGVGVSSVVFQHILPYLE